MGDANGPYGRSMHYAKCRDLIAALPVVTALPRLARLAAAWGGVSSQPLCNRPRSWLAHKPLCGGEIISSRIDGVVELCGLMRPIA
jgi:hypothetical protein